MNWEWGERERERKKIDERTNLKVMLRKEERQMSLSSGGKEMNVYGPHNGLSFKERKERRWREKRKVRVRRKEEKEQK